MILKMNLVFSPTRGGFEQSILSAIRLMSFCFLLRRYLTPTCRLNSTPVGFYIGHTPVETGVLNRLHGFSAGSACRGGKYDGTLCEHPFLGTVHHPAVKQQSNSRSRSDFITPDGARQ